MPEPANHHSKIRTRARLAIRAERALGLVQLPVDFPSASIPTASVPVASQMRTVTPKSTPAAMVSPQFPTKSPSKAPNDLFAKPSSPIETPSHPFTSLVLSLERKKVALRQLDEMQVKGCQKCRLHTGRYNTVFGEGDPDAKIMFIGEGPGENEDKEGRPFVGRAGELLDKMIAGMGFRRDQVYIANIVKCRPPDNRQPMPDEAGACLPYLLEQIEVVRPQAIVTLGLTATKFLLNTNLSMNKMRGQWHSWRGIQVMPTFHPSYVLRQYTPDIRAAVWSDLKMVLTALGIALPSRG